jgi:hypothetical protein
MKKYIFILMTVLLLSQTHLWATKYAGEIFKMGAGVRNYSMGKLGVTDRYTPALAYWNASLLLQQEKRAFELMHAEEFHGIVKYDTFSGTIGESNRVGFTLSRIGVNNITLTRLENDDEDISINNRPVKYKSINNSDYILYVGFARYIGKVPLGITPKIVYRNLAEVPAFGFGADISTHFVAHENFILGLRIRDAIPTQIYWDNGTREYVKIGFDAEAQIRSKLPVLNSDMVFYLNCEINTEGVQRSATANIGATSFDPHLGVEFILHPRLSFFAGYNIDNVTTGVGINYQQFLLNYSFEQNSELDNSHRFSIGYMF